MDSVFPLCVIFIHLNSTFYNCSFSQKKKKILNGHQNFNSSVGVLSGIQTINHLFEQRTAVMETVPSIVTLKLDAPKNPPWTESQTETICANLCIFKTVVEMLHHTALLLLCLHSHMHHPKRLDMDFLPTHSPPVRRLYHISILFLV